MHFVGGPLNVGFLMLWSQESLEEVLYNGLMRARGDCRGATKFSPAQYTGASQPERRRSERYVKTPMDLACQVTQSQGQARRRGNEDLRSQSQILCLL